MTTATATPAPVADPRRAGRVGAGVRRVVPAAIAAVLVLALWETAVRVFEIRPILLPAPTSIAATFVDDLPRLGEAVWTTGRASVLGFLLGGAAGFLAGVVVANWSWLREGMLPVGVGLGAIPIVATAPIFNLWFGALSVWSSTAVVALVVFFPMLVNTITGMQSAEPGHLELMRSLAAPKRTVLTKLLLPTSLPFVFGALRVGAALAVIASVVADFFGGFRTSAGFFIKTLMATANYTGAWATVVALCLFGLALYGLVASLERWLVPTEQET